MSLLLDRRSFIVQLSAAGFSAVAQAEGALNLSNRLGVRARPATDDPSRPILWVSLPASDAHAIAVELPEHAWGRPRGTTEQRYFYRMYGGDRALRAPPRWQRIGSALRSTLVGAAGVTIESTVTLDEDGVSMEHRLSNGGDTDYEEVQAPTCIKLYRPFNDLFLERTWVRDPDGLQLLASDAPERLRMNAEEWLPARYVARSQPPAVTPEGRIGRLPEGIVRYERLRVLEAPFLATTSLPAGWVAASHTLRAKSIFTNPARTCHHVDAHAPLRPGETAVLSLKLYLLRGTATEAWQRVRRSRAAGKS